MFKNLTFKSDAAFWPGGIASTSPGTSQPKGLVARTFSALVSELMARRAARSLASLDARMLKDIGVDRDQIWYAARYGRDAMRRSVDQRTDFTRWS